MIGLVGVYAVSGRKMGWETWRLAHRWEGALNPTRTKRIPGPGKVEPLQEMIQDMVRFLLLCFLRSIPLYVCTSAWEDEYDSREIVTRALAIQTQHWFVSRKDLRGVWGQGLESKNLLLGYQIGSLFIVPKHLSRSSRQIAVSWALKLQVHIPLYPLPDLALLIKRCCQRMLSWEQLFLPLKTPQSSAPGSLC